MTKVQLDYAPRRAFLPFHNRTQRWACLVAHRRAGKTVAAINDLIRAALNCKSKFPLFAYIAPFRVQAKSVAWTYLKQFAAPITQSVNEAELTVTLVNGAVIRLFGADNADAIRGLGFDGVVADEFGDWKPSVFPLVVRPALSDKQGWFVAMGTPKQRNSFYDIYVRAQKSPEWFCMSLPADKSGLLPPTELDAARAQLTEDQFAQEYLCSFDAAIVGAYYGVEMRMAMDQNRIKKLQYNPDFPVYTAWDLGYRDDTAIWFYQVARGEVHVLDFHASSGSTIRDLANVVLSKPYKYGKHHLPHDARAKTLASGGKSVIEQMAEFLGISNLAIVPDLSVQDGIQAVRMMLHRCWFDADKCQDGLEALRQYQREYDEDKKAFRERPVHNFCSHPADAFRMLAIAWREEPQASRPLEPKALIVGPQNEVTLNEMWAAHEQYQPRRARI
jgi:phage terminase large subunit